MRKKSGGGQRDCIPQCVTGQNLANPEMTEKRDALFPDGHIVQVVADIDVVWIIYGFVLGKAYPSLR